MSETVIPKPSESHIWLNGDWVKDTDAPKGYKPPISSVPSYSPAWMAFLNPYTFVLPDTEDNLEISLEQINSNSYDGDKLSEAIATLPLINTRNINGLITYDGAIAIPRNADYPSVEIALDNINRISCAILLGGIHAEVTNPRELLSGSLLENKKNIFVYHPGLHSRLRHKQASVQERIILMHPRTVRVSELKAA